MLLIHAASIIIASANLIFCSIEVMYIFIAILKIFPLVALVNGSCLFELVCLIFYYSYDYLIFFSRGCH